MYPPKCHHCCLGLSNSLMRYLMTVSISSLVKYSSSVRGCIFNFYFLTNLPVASVLSSLWSMSLVKFTWLS